MKKFPNENHLPLLPLLWRQAGTVGEEVDTR